MNEQHKVFLQQAIEMASENVIKGTGGPFGALVVQNNKVIGRGVNMVTSTNDPTAHAEIVAIRDACKQKNDFQLKGAVIYASCEPCPMCLSAIYWARIERIYFAAENTDAAKAGFDDSFIYKEIPLPLDKRSIPISKIPCDHAFKPFETWIREESKIRY
jgi:guanine deaminase